MKQIHLPPGPMKGLVIGDPGAWTGLDRYVKDKDGNGHDLQNVPPEGIELVGAETEPTVLMPGTSDEHPGFLTDTTLGIYAGPVKLTDLKVHGGARTAIHANPKHLAPIRVDYELVEVLPRPDGTPPRWGVQSYLTRGIARRCRFAPGFHPNVYSEHAWYQHGLDKDGETGGYLFEQCYFGFCAREGLKVTNRPDLESAEKYEEKTGIPPKKHALNGEGTPFTKGCTIVVQDCVIESWGQSGFGGGMVVQGSGANGLVQRCIFRGPNMAFAMDAESEFYSPKGVPYVGIGNQHWGLEQVLIEVSDTRRPLLRAFDTLSFRLKGCGLYGPADSRVTFGRSEGVHLMRSGCNTDAIREFAEGQGVDTRYEPRMPDGKLVGATVSQEVHDG